MLLDESPGYPMTFIVQISFEGDLERDAFASAVQQALLRHPLLRAIIRPKKQNRDCWVAAEGDFSVRFLEQDQDIEFEQGEFIDLRNDVGLRMWVQQGDGRGVVTAQFHHATCDGIGSYQFLGDVLWYYAEQVDATDLEPLPEVSLTELRNRLRATYKPEHYQLANGKFRTEWKSTFRWYCTQVNRLRPPRTSPAERAFPGIESIEFDKKWYRQFRKVAQSLAVTANELLLEKMMVALRQWNCLHGGSDRGSMCMMVPLDLRDSKNYALPATNVVTYAFVRAKQSLLDNLEGLRDSLRDQMMEIKNSRHKCRFNNMIVGFVNYKRVMQWVVALPKCLATATFSNTGDPSRRFYVDFPKDGDFIRCGNLRVTGFAGVPPMRPNTRATTSVFTYRRGLKICVRCDPMLFSVDDTRELLSILEGELREVVGDQP